MFSFVEIDPPGTICQTAAIREVVRFSGARRFVEIGCGAGRMSKLLVEWGLTGVGVESSKDALLQARRHLEGEIAAGDLRLVAGDAMKAGVAGDERFDLALAVMVMEHIEDDGTFLSRMRDMVRPGGMVVVMVPGRMDRWNVEDETVGHVRRYEREELLARIQECGLVDPAVWSVSVPVANVCFHAGNALIRLAGETRKRTMGAKAQTELSGIRRIPFKTVFPRCFKLVLNEWTMAPLVWVQRKFYRSSLGLTLLGFGRVG